MTSEITIMKRCRFNRSGSVTLSSDYLKYRKDGGQLNPRAWNCRIKQLEAKK